MNRDGLVLIKRMDLVEAFWHERFGAVMYFRVECDPPSRDYVFTRLRDCANEREAADRAKLIIWRIYGDSREALPAIDGLKN